jgi:AcrR family transcriptional regulator
VGLRESKKLETRREIADTAMRLFVQRGFDHVTVAEVAAAARVSEKTVFNYFPTKEDLFFDELPERQAALIAAIRDRAPGQSIVAALRRLQVAECPRLCSAGFAVFARIIEESPALQAKELEVMAQMTELLGAAIRDELGVHEVDAKIAANMLVGVHWQLFRNARAQALSGRQGPAAVRHLRSDLDRAYRLLEHGLGALESSGSIHAAG